MNAIILRRSIYTLLAPLFLTLALLACAGTALHALPSATCPPTTPGTTPVVIRPPQPFHSGDAVIVGAEGASLRAQFVLEWVDVSAHSAESQVVSWALTIHNLGHEDIDILPALQMTVSALDDGDETVTGAWAATDAAAAVVGLTSDSDLYTLSAGETHTVALAAFTPPGAVEALRWQLDPTVLDGSAVIDWTTAPNTICP